MTSNPSPAAPPVPMTAVELSEEDWDAKDAAQHSDATGAGAPCPAGKFRAAGDTLFDTLSETQAWYNFVPTPMMCVCLITAFVPEQPDPFYSYDYIFPLFVLLSPSTRTSMTWATQSFIL